VVKSDFWSLEPIDSFFGALRLAAVTGGWMWGLWAPIDPETQQAFFACVAAGAVSSLLLLELLKRYPLRTQIFYRTWLVADAVLIYWAVRVTGGSDSIFVVGFYLLVSIHAFHAGLPVGMAAATIVSVLLSTLQEGGLWWGDSLLRIAFLYIAPSVNPSIGLLFFSAYILRKCNARMWMSSLRSRRGGIRKLMTFSR
jgi:hypothetical protein